MAEMSNEVILKTVGLNKTYISKGKVETKALEDINFELHQGEVLGIVGESGSGKTTLGRIITGSLLPDSGNLYLFGEDVNKLKGKKRDMEFFHCRMVYQIVQEAFNQKKSIGDGLAADLAAMGYKKKDQLMKAVELLDVCGLSQEFIGHYPYEVSGGQSVRACVAKAITCDPEILVCDEVTRALDSSEQKRIVQLLFAIKREYNLSLVFISHDLALVSHFCDRIIVMENGKIVEEGPAKEVISNPQTEFAKKLVERATTGIPENAVVGAMGFARAKSLAKRDGYDV